MLPKLVELTLEKNSNFLSEKITNFFRKTITGRDMGQTCGSQHFVSLRKLIVTHPCLLCQQHQITSLQESNSNKALQKTSHRGDMENEKKSILTQK
jgi:hypothetical protein